MRRFCLNFIPILLSAALITSSPVKAADTYFYDAKKQPVSVSSLKGKPTIIYAYKSNCSICLRTLSALDKFHPENEKDLNIFAVIMEDVKPTDVRKLFTKQNIRTLPIYIDKEQNLASVFHFYITPMTILLDENGQMKTKIRGKLNWDSPFFSEKLKNLNSTKDKS